MKKSSTRLCTGLLLAATVQAHAGVDAKLLDMLLANGSITKAQHAELSADLAREQRAAKKAAKDSVSKKEFTELKQLAGWTMTTKLAGDMRVREETIDIEEAPGASFKDKDRQRIRARPSAVTQVNPQVEIGIQVASGSSNDARSTNQDLDNYFTKQDLWLDLGYIDRPTYETALAQELKPRSSAVVAGEAPRTRTRAEFAAELARQLVYEVFREETYTRGLNVTTTIRQWDQEVAYASLRRQVLEYDRKYGYRVQTRLRFSKGGFSLGQKVNPIGLRLGIVKTWESRWFGGKNYADYIFEDFNLRKFIKQKLYHAGVSRIEIERRPSASGCAFSPPVPASSSVRRARRSRS